MKKYITYSTLMKVAIFDASNELRRSKAANLRARAQNSLYEKDGLKHRVAVPRVKTWGQCLSEAMKRLYRERNVVASLTLEMIEHNQIVRLMEDQKEVEYEYYNRLGSYTMD